MRSKLTTQLLTLSHSQIWRFIASLAHPKGFRIWSNINMFLSVCTRTIKEYLWITLTLSLPPALLLTPSPQPLTPDLRPHAPFLFVSSATAPMTSWSFKAVSNCLRTGEESDEVKPSLCWCAVPRMSWRDRDTSVINRILSPQHH